jgi:hypothetical protein
MIAKLLKTSMMIRFFTTIFAFVILITTIQAQTDTEQLKNKRAKTDYGFYNVIDFKYHHGRFLKNSGTLDDIMDNPYDALDFRVGFQSDGKNQIWDQIYGFPVYGIGFYNAYFEGGELGSPAALYMFMRAPVIKGKKLSWNWELAVGLSYGFYPYNPNDNPDQQVIGSDHNVYFNAATGISYNLGSRWDITLDMDVTHFSNGSTRTPNLGVNLVGLALGGRYNFNPVRNYTKKIDPDYQPPHRPVLIRKEIPKYNRHSEIIIFGSMGGKTTTTQIYDGPTYFISSLSVDYAWAYHHVGKVGIGFDAFYESALRDYPEKIENPSLSDLSFFGWHIAHYLKMYRLTLVTQIGFNLSDHVSHKGNTYIQVGGSFDITDQFFARAALKTRNGAVADFIEWGLGYRIPFAYSQK